MEKVPVLRAPAFYPGLLALALLGGMGCYGSHAGNGQVVSRGATFTLSPSPSSLSIPAGGSGYVTVIATRHGGFSGAITLSVDTLPSGMTASGSIPAGETTGRLTVAVDASVGTADLGSLQVQGLSGTLKRYMPLALAVLSPLPAASLSPDRVQASGALQAADGLQNQILVEEPVEASLAQDSAGTLGLRHGFLPVPNPAQP